MFPIYISRSYKPRIIDDAFKRISQIERKAALKRVSKANQDNTVLATTYHPLMPSVSKIVKKHWRVMTQESTLMKNCFSKPSVIAYKRHNNLRDMLVRAKLPPKRGPRRLIKGFKSCGELCKLCIVSPRGVTKNHICKRTDKSYEIGSHINCKTTGAIYKITCNKCPYFTYIGETSKPLKQRISQHYGDAERKDQNKPCGKHFSLPGHSILNMCAIGIEEVIPKDDAIYRRIRETLWINVYQSVEFGGNTRS